MDTRRRLGLLLALLGVLGGIQSSSAIVIEKAQRGVSLFKELI